MTSIRSSASCALAAAVAAAALAGCGTDRAREAPVAAQKSTVEASTNVALRADYDQNWGELGRVHMAVTTTGPEQVRVRWTTPEDDPVSEVVWIYDGEQFLEYGNDPEGYTLYTKPRQSEGFELVRSLVLPPGSDQLAEACPEARRLGVRTISGRATVGYRCRWKDIDTFGEAREIWVDEATGLVLDAREDGAGPGESRRAGRRQHVLHLGARGRRGGRALSHADAAGGTWWLPRKTLRGSYVGLHPLQPAPGVGVEEPARVGRGHHEVRVVADALREHRGVQRLETRVDRRPERWGRARRPG